MGGGISKEKLQEIRQNHIKKLNEELDQQQQEEDSAIEAIDSEFTNAILDEEDRLDLELTEESVNNLKEIDKHMLQFRELERNIEAMLKSLEQNNREKTKEEVAKYEAAYKKEIEKQRKECQEKQAKLEETNKNLHEKREELIAIVHQEHERRKQMQREHDEADVRSKEEHQKKMKESNEEFKKILSDYGKAMKALVEGSRETQKALEQTQKNLFQFKMTAVKSLTTAIRADYSHDDLQSDVNRFKSLFSSFKNEYTSPQMQKQLFKTIAYMEDLKELKILAQTGPVLSAFESFKTNSENLSLPSEYKKLIAKHTEINEILATLLSVFTRIEYSIESYQEAWKQLKVEPEATDKAKKCYNNIKESTDALQGSIKKLSTLMLEFHIPREDHVQKTLDQMHSDLTTKSDLQITDGPSGSDQGRITN